MTSGENVSGEKAIETTQPALCRQEFLERLRVQGYARRTVRTYAGIVGQFCAEVEKRSLGAGKLDGAAVEAVRRAVLAKTSESARTYAKFCLTRFIDYLIDSGVANLPEPAGKKPTALDRLREEYDAYLRQQRALSEATIYHCHRFLERFMTFRFGDSLGDLNAITPDDIIAFLGQLKAGSRPYRDKTPPTHLRNLFKFLFWSGKTKRNLANSVPRMVRRNRRTCRGISDRTRFDGWSRQPVRTILSAAAITRCCCLWLASACDRPKSLRFGSRISTGERAKS